MSVDRHHIAYGVHCVGVCDHCTRTEHVPELVPGVWRMCVWFVEDVLVDQSGHAKPLVRGPERYAKPN